VLVKSRAWSRTFAPNLQDRRFYLPETKTWINLRVSTNGLRTIINDYTRRDGTRRERDIDPFGLVARHGCWYIPARDHPSGELRTFRADRISSALIGDGAAPPEPGFDPAAYVVRMLARLPWAHEIEVHVDVDVKSPRHLEDAVNLPTGVGVGVGRRTHHTCAALQGFYHEIVSPGIIQKTLLGKDTDLDVHGPLVRLNEGQDTLQAPQPDTRVDFEVGAHEGGTVQDAFFQSAHGAGADVGGGELLLDGCHLCNRFVEVPFL
jgi:hypothetical protein